MENNEKGLTEVTKPRKVSTKRKVLPPKGEYLIQIKPQGGKVVWTGNGKDWLVKDREKAQVYKTLKGAERWIEKFAGKQGKTKIIPK